MSDDKHELLAAAELLQDEVGPENIAIGGAPDDEFRELLHWLLPGFLWAGML